MTKLHISSLNNVIVDCDEDRPTIPVTLPPKSDMLYDDLGALEMLKNSSIVDGFELLKELSEEDESHHDRPTVDYSKPVAA